MGLQHNTTIFNDTQEVVEVILTDPGGGITVQRIDKGAHTAIPTPHGRVTIGVRTKQDREKWSEKAVVQYTDDSDRSFIITKLDGGEGVNILRSTYGHAHTEDTKARVV